MSQAWPSDSDDPCQLATDDIAATAVLSKLVYRSRAVDPLSESELYNLALAAQARNRAEQITGLMLYDRDSFFQWLEGPAESVERIMRSIQNDPRHTDIEVIDNQAAQSRRFADWSMKLAAKGQGPASWRNDVIEPPLHIIEGLHQHPDAAPVLLAKLLPAYAAVSNENVAESRSGSRALLNRHAASMLKAVILDTVIPELANNHDLTPSRSGYLPIDKRMPELADLLIAADQTAAVQLIKELHAEAAATLLHYATLFEPAARRLGDLWSEDLCSEFDVTLGLCRIQTAARLLGSDAMPRRPGHLPGPEVLIAPEPGELHRLGAALDSEVLWNVGWNPHCEYPADDHALQDLVAATWFDVLDLSLSAALRREHWLPRLAKTIAEARHASRNPALVVVVGGRVFVERGGAGAQVGADMANVTALHLERSIRERLRTNA